MLQPLLDAGKGLGWVRRGCQGLAGGPFPAAAVQYTHPKTPVPKGPNSETGGPEGKSQGLDEPWQR